MSYYGHTQQQLRYARGTGIVAAGDGMTRHSDDTLLLLVLSPWHFPIPNDGTKKRTS